MFKNSHYFIASVIWTSTISSISDPWWSRRGPMRGHPVMAVRFWIPQFFYKERSDSMTSWRFSDIYSRSLKSFFRFSDFYSHSLKSFIRFYANCILYQPFFGQIWIQSHFSTKKSLLGGFLPLFSLKCGPKYL